MAPRGLHLYQSNAYQLPHRPASAAKSPSPDGLSQTSPSGHSSGTKRSRSGRPLSPVLTSNSSPNPIRRDARPRHRCKQSISSISSRSVSSSSDSESDGSSSSSDEEEEYTLPSDHHFQGVRSGLQLFAYTYACKWKSSANYGAPADDRLPPRPRKRARFTGRIKQDEDPSDSQLVVISRRDGYFHLKCPYYVLNSAKYRRCLLQHDLQSVEAVIDHLCNHHMEPPCCAMCYRVFDRARDRDDHMSKRTCEFRTPVEIDGINLYQKEKLSRSDRVYHGEKRRWDRVWKTVFPNTDPPQSPYLDRGVGLEISMVRDYWAANGRDVVSQYLARQGLHEHQQDDGRAMSALASLALQDLLILVMKEHDA